MAESAPDSSLLASRVFTPAAPIDSEALFAGRIQQVQQVVDAINQRGQHAVIFGERGVGKTSLSNILPKKLTANVPIFVSRVNCVTGDNFDSVWRKQLDALGLKLTSRQIGFQSQDQFSITADALAALIPERTLTPEDVRRVLTVVAEAGALVVLIIDEFDRIQAKTQRALFADTVKVFSDYAVDVTLILVGVADTVGNLIDQHLSIERALVQVRIPRMSREEIQEIVLKGVRTLGMTVDGAALRQIALMSQGLPHYTHLLGLHATREAIEEGSRTIERVHLEPAIRRALGGSQQTVQALYHKATLSARPGNLFCQVLLACALAEVDDLGYFAASDVRQPMSAIMGRDYDIPTFSRHLYDFCEASRGSVLERTGESRRYRFRFQNPLLQPYVTMRGFADGLLSPKMLDMFFSDTRDA